MVVVAAVAATMIVYIIDHLSRYAALRSGMGGAGAHVKHGHSGHE